MADSDPQQSLETEKPATSEVKPDAQHDSEATADKPESPALPRRILVIDLGGTKVKVLASGEREPRKAPSGPEMSPQKMIEEVNELAKGWEYADFARLSRSGGSSGASLRSGQPRFRLGRIRLCRRIQVTGACAQRRGHAGTGCYEGGKMLFLGLGTGLGSTLIAGRAIVPLELGRLRYPNASAGRRFGPPGTGTARQKGVASGCV